jgi:hypothetical protein
MQLMRRSFQNRRSSKTLERLAAIVTDGKSSQQAVADLMTNLKADVVHRQRAVRTREHACLEYTIVVKGTRYTNVEDRVWRYTEHARWIAGVNVDEANAANTFFVTPLHVDAQRAVVQKQRRRTRRMGPGPPKVTSRAPDDAQLSPFHF